MIVNRAIDAIKFEQTRIHLSVFMKSIKHLWNYIIIYKRNRHKLYFCYSSHIAPTSKFEGNNSILENSTFKGSMGYGSFISSHCEISAYIGRYTSIAPHVRTNRGIHPFTYPYVSTCPMFYSTRKQNRLTFATHGSFEEMRRFTTIGNDCWIGENVFFVGGITIGDGAVILAGAVVTKNVPPYAVVGGVPAKVIKYRYDNDTIDFLLRFKWWNKDIKWLKANWELFNDIELFRKLYDCNYDGNCYTEDL